MDFGTGYGGVEWIIGFSFIVFICLPGIFALILQSNTLALGMILTTAFTRVLFHLAGIPRLVPTLFTEFCVLLLLAKAVYRKLLIKKKPLRIIGFHPMLGLLVVVFVSYFLNQSDPLPAVFFIRQTFIFYLFFVALLNLDLTDNTITKINKYIILLFLIQLPAAAIKFIIIGQEEGLGIGTVSWQGGQFSTTLPLFAISFLMAFYFFKKDRRCLLWVVGFLFFGIVGQKRALALFVPVIVIVIWSLYGKRDVLKEKFRFRRSQFKYFLVIALITYMGFFFSARFLGDEMYGEGLKVSKLIEYIVWYNTRVPIEDDNTMGRFTITMVTLDRLKNSSIINQFIGLGPGKMIRSPHLGREGAASEAFGIRGALSGFIVFVLQVGFLGVIFFTYFFLTLFRKAYILYRKSSNIDFKIVALGFMGATFVFLLDFFIYSSSTMFFGVLTPVYFYVATIVLRGDSHNFKLFSQLNNKSAFSIKSILFAHKEKI